MSPHASAEALSAYLDRQLPAAEARRVEIHLADCPACQNRYEGLRGVVASLHRLDRSAPPDTLGRAVARRIELEGGESPLLDRFELSLGGFDRQSSFLGLFGLIVAFAVMILLFAQALERQRHRTIPVVFDGPSAAGATTVTIADRLLHRHDELWIEAGVEPSAAVQRTVEVGSPTFHELVALHPELAELEGLGATAVVRIGDEIVRFDTGLLTSGAPSP